MWVSLAVTLLLPLLIAAMAVAMTRRELQQFRRDRFESRALFPYTPLRLARRLGGIVVLLVVGGTLAMLGIVPPATSHAAARFVVAILGEVSLLFGLSLWDLWESGRSARPNPPPVPHVAVRPPGTPLH